ncbi:substrate-binding domain-containing protein [Vallitalea pronyensis]|uniref:Substrate-binding domain-containing protein n=1 Tax=Vallitalea pronyensis TaxID=1348613 RepID=A0A8J8MNA9_9FIRM|nr:substrate-binding domain-containing protein [Vallitalea pronyensis]QUI24591.1 substrate-binding domain-containing protein [Vallitalea pronyensis]
MTKQPKHKMLKAYIIEHIEDGSYPSQEAIPSENALCRQFNTSRVTVRKAIDALVMENYLYRLQGVGTFVQDKSLRLQQDTPNRIDIIFHDNNFLFSEFNSNIIQGAEKILQQSGLTLATYYAMNQVNNQYDKIQNAINEGAKGIILCGCLEDERETMLKAFTNAPIPIVCIDRYFESLPFDAVIGRDYEAGYEAGQIFAQKGYQHIGYYYPYAIESSVSKGRVEGLIAALKNHQIQIIEPCLIRHTKSTKHHMYDYHQISKDIQHYLQRHQDLDAVLTFNDITALLFYKEASRLDIRIPLDLALISFGDFYIDAIFEVGLTSFNQHPYKMGEEAAKIIINRLINPSNQTRKVIRIDYDLIKRNSCG